jgi:hypothetical protein
MQFFLCNNSMDNNNRVRYVDVREDLFHFVVKMEDLDFKNPVLDLRGQNGYTSIRQQLLWALKTKKDLGAHNPTDFYKFRIGYILDARTENTGRVHLDGSGISRFNRFLNQFKIELSKSFGELAKSIAVSPDALRQFATYIEHQADVDKKVERLADGWEYAELAFRLKKFKSKTEAYDHFLSQYSSDTVEERENIKRYISRLRNIRQRGVRG